MKRFITCALATLAVVSAAAEQKQAVVLHAADGGRVVYFLHSTPSLTASASTLTVTDVDGTHDYPLEDIAFIDVALEEYDGTPTLEADAPVVRVTPDAITVFNPRREPVMLYSLTGLCVDSGSAEELSFTPERGIYVVTVGSRSYKIKF